MKKTSLLAAALGTAAVLALSPAQAEVEKVTLEMAHIYNPGNIWYDVAERYAEGVKEATGGNVTINIAAGGSTGTWQEAIEALQIGTNDIVLQSIGTLDRYDPLPGIEAFPYLIRDLDHFNKVYYGEVGAELFDAIEEATQFKIVGAGFRGARKLSCNCEVTEVSDLEGVKLRVPPLKMYRRTWELLGASPVPMPALEIYTALQQGVIDGQENPLETILTFKWHEHQSHIMNTDHVIGAMTFIYDSPRFQQFSDELKTILIEQGEAAMKWGTERMMEQEEGYADELRAAGVTIQDVNREAFAETVAPIRDEFPELADWVERIKAVQ
ncbi:TRAP transporter substrate-binding protein [Acuticoccus kandeliae]|uniref:TRAP transporter substrate-binding protein n=1 Tax=Acuticoccus kandeliae TaxID=2073160 RepID=UPI000D3EBA9A|nr:TRAP transporter substrate-binding protein [Acuticoccus kandeliae]